jgi:hypothetical protein
LVYLSSTATPTSFQHTPFNNQAAISTTSMLKKSLFNNNQQVKKLKKQPKSKTEPKAQLPEMKVCVGTQQQQPKKNRQCKENALSKRELVIP